jgi:hypothetical protein
VQQFIQHGNIDPLPSFFLFPTRVFSYYSGIERPRERESDIDLCLVGFLCRLGLAVATPLAIRDSFTLMDGAHHPTAGSPSWD